MSIYRSPAGKRHLHELYEAAVDRLEFGVDSLRIETRHGTTHVLLAGSADARPVVLFHGGNATNPMTLRWYSTLADRYRLIAPDTIGQPGMSAERRVHPLGDAYGEWVVDVMEAFDLESAPMVGTSYGAGIVLRTAAVAPDRIDRAAMVVPAGFGTGSLGSLLRIGVPSLLYRYLSSPLLLDSVLNAMAAEDDLDPVVRETVSASLRHVKLERTFPTAEVAELAEFSAPVSLFVAEDDPFFPPESTVPRAHELLRNLVDTQVLAGERHLLSRGAQDRVTSGILEFFER